MKCYHHGDADGNAAAYVVKAKFSSETIDFVKINYDMDIELSKISPNEKIAVVDFAFSPEIFRKILEITKDIIWIDHHERCLEPTYAEFKDIPGIRNTEDAACVLAWKYFFPDQEMPRAILLIGDFDAWHWKYKEETRYFLEASNLYDLSPASEFWQNLTHVRHFTRDLTHDGKVISTFKKQQFERLVYSIGHIVEFEGYQCFAINTKEFDSKYFENMDIVSAYPIHILFDDRGDCVTVSLRSNTGNIRVKELAEKYGGGGHAFASGFRSKEKPWKFVRKLPKKDF
jgi:oligoribonuclease NrnB/cAMP/cGMP phosphodiesterase (DHH superfamily)